MLFEVAGEGVVHDAARGRVEEPHADDVVAPLVVEVGGIAAGQHRRMHLRIRPAVARGLRQVGVALVDADVPVDRLEHVRPGHAATAVARQLRDADPVDLQRRLPQVRRHPAHSNRAEFHPRGGEGGAFEVHGVRRITRWRGKELHLRGVRAKVVPALGRRIELVELESEREGIGEAQHLEDLGHAQIVAILRPRKDRDAGARARVGVRHHPEERGGDHPERRMVVEVAGGGDAAGVTLDPHRAVVADERRRLRLQLQEVCALRQRKQPEPRDRQRQPLDPLQPLGGFEPLDRREVGQRDLVRQTGELKSANICISHC